MDINISFEQPEWNEIPAVSHKLMVVVTFPNCISTTTNKPFKWMPTYDQIEQIRNALSDIEYISWNGKGDINE